MENVKIVRKPVDFGGTGSIDWKYSTAKPNKPSKNAESLLQTKSKFFLRFNKMFQIIKLRDCCISLLNMTVYFWR
jgi:hypothetical protein